jgi:hypothetical protein
VAIDANVLGGLIRWYRDVTGTEQAWPGCGFSWSLFGSTTTVAGASTRRGGRAHTHGRMLTPDASCVLIDRFGYFSKLRIKSRDITRLYSLTNYATACRCRVLMIDATLKEQILLYRGEKGARPAEKRSHKTRIL